MSTFGIADAELTAAQVAKLPTDPARLRDWAVKSIRGAHPIRTNAELNKALFDAMLNLLYQSPMAALVRITGPGLVAMLGMVALWLVAAVVWLLGHRRITVALRLVFAAATVAETSGARDGSEDAVWNLVDVTLPVLAAAAALVLAAWRGVQAPRPRRAWLLLSLATAVVWVMAIVVGPLAGVYVLRAGVSVVVLAAAVVTALIFAGLLPPWLGLFVIVATAGAAISPRAGQDAPLTGLAA